MGTVESSEPRSTFPRKRARALEWLVDRVPAAVAGASLTILLHALLVTSILWAGGALFAHRAHTTPGGGALSQGPNGPAVQDITLELISAVSSRRSIRNADPSITPKLAAIHSAKSLAADLAATAKSLDAELEGASAAAGDRAALAAMAGRYVGQIDARIERAWLRPRTAIGAPVFLCRVRITQDRGGNVLGVSVEQCNGTRRWQRSLIAAIETASPLPAPPDPHVFASVVHMGFRARPYTRGSPPGEYEPERLAKAAVASARRSQQSADQGLGHLHDALQHPRAHEVIKLTLTGSGSEGPANLPPVAPRPPVLAPSQ